MDRQIAVLSASSPQIALSCASRRALMTRRGRHDFDSTPIAAAIPVMATDMAMTMRYRSPE